MISEERKNVCRMLTEGLNERDLFILEHRILGSMLLEEVGGRYGISRERVRQLEKKLKHRLLTRLIRSRNAVPSYHEYGICGLIHGESIGTNDHKRIVRAKDIDGTLIDDTLQGLLGGRIALELENGEMAEGVVTKVRSRRVHLSSPTVYGMNESIVDVDEIVALHRIDRFDAPEELRLYAGRSGGPHAETEQDV